MGRLVRAFFVGAALIGATLVSACGAPVPDAAPAPPTYVEHDCTSARFDLVEASEVEISGDLDNQKRAMVEWALDRFDRAGALKPDLLGAVRPPDRTGAARSDRGCVCAGLRLVGSVSG
jgi:hypothetical protein